MIDQPEVVPWLFGVVDIKPEFKYRTIPTGVPPVSSGAFIFYISADEVPAVAKMETTKRSLRDEGFICYSHADEKWLKRVRVHLRPLERRRVFKLFDDSQIEPGKRWKDEIKAALDRARVAILLVSADFLASEFIAENELPPLLKKAKNGGAIILPVIVSHCGFLKEDGLADYQAVNDPSKPLDSLTESESEKVLTKLADAVEAALAGVNGSKATTGVSKEPATDTRQKELPKSEAARQVLQLIQAGADPENRGLTEILESPEPGYTFFLPGLRDAGRTHKMKSRLFREAMSELLSLGWLYPPEHTGATRIYEFKSYRDWLPSPKAEECLSRAAELLKNKKDGIIMNFHGLYRAKAYDLESNDDLIWVCNRLVAHGYSHPFEGLDECMPQNEWLDFMKWGHLHARWNFGEKGDYLRAAIQWSNERGRPLDEKKVWRGVMAETLDQNRYG
jgi:hypothetical protein